MNDQCPNYLSDNFGTALENSVQTRGSLQTLKFSFCKTSAGQIA